MKNVVREGGKNTTNKKKELILTLGFVTLICTMKHLVGQSLCIFGIEAFFSYPHPEFTLSPCSFVRSDQAAMLSTVLGLNTAKSSWAEDTNDVITPLSVLEYGWWKQNG